MKVTGAQEGRAELFVFLFLTPHLFSRCNPAVVGEAAVHTTTTTTSSFFSALLVQDLVP